VVADGSPRLLDRVRHEIRRRHYSRRTEKAYVCWIRRYVIFHGKRHPNDLGAAEVTSYLSHLAVAEQVSASTQNQAFSALLFLYRSVLGRELSGLGQHPGQASGASSPGADLLSFGFAQGSGGCGTARFLTWSAPAVEAGPGDPDGLADGGDPYLGSQLLRGLHQSFSTSSRFFRGIPMSAPTFF
jgi:hypothetical protein